MTPELRIFLEKIASLPAWNDDDDFMVDDRAGGNVDDAYNGGQNDGEILLARQLLKEFGGA